MDDRNVLPKVFGWMFVGLVISFLTGIFISNNPNMIFNLYNNGMIWLIAIGELILVAVLSARIQKMKSTTATILFVAYSFLTGFTLSAIFFVYDLLSVVLVFGVSALIFAIFALLGMYTKVDLSKLGTILIMGLIGLLIATLINIFLGNDMVDIMINAIGILIFIGLTAYDIQKIKNLSYMIADSHNAAILGALELYLDFINIFIRLINLFGKSRD